MIDVEERKDDIINVLKGEGNIIEITGKTLVVGDLHGDFHSFNAAVKKFKNGDFKNILFLGDYVDRGSKGKEIVDSLFEMKMNCDNVYTLRGNHETYEINSYYGFLMELKAKKVDALHSIYNEIFSYMPVACIINKKIFCVHGGICPELTSLNKIKKIRKGDIEPGDSLLLGLLWSDPSEDIEEYGFNFARYVGYYYGKKAVENFLEMTGFEGILRAHQVFPEGYRWFFDRKLLSVFTSASYVSVKPKVAVVDGICMTAEDI